jgi:hypothetical protein
MPRTITIFAPGPGYSIDWTLQRALNLLRSNNVEVLAAAQNLSHQGDQTATILLAYLDDNLRPRAIQLLLRAGISVEN